MESSQRSWRHLPSLVGKESLFFSTNSSSYSASQIYYRYQVHVSQLVVPSISGDESLRDNPLYEEQEIRMEMFASDSEDEDEGMDHLPESLNPIAPV